MFKLGKKKPRIGVKRDEGTVLDIFWCLCCGRSESRQEITLRKFDAGFSACCNQEMSPTPPEVIAPRCDSARCGSIKHATV